MPKHLAIVWDRLRTGYWFVPTVMVLASAALAFGSVELDRRLAPSEDGLSWLYSGGAEGARQTLAVIAGSMITVAGVTFSILIVALTLASQQFGPRLLRNFQRDTTNQVTLGTFVSTFVYCLLVLRTVRGLDTESFVPHLSVTIGVLLAGSSLFILIYFIHHVASSITASHIVANVSGELLDAIRRLFPQELGQDPPAEPDHGRELRELERRRPTIARAHRSGYVQSIDADALLGITSKADLIVRMRVRPGDFVAEGVPVAEVFGDADDDAARGVADAVAIGTLRTTHQDPVFAIDQLVEISLRALSPGINDPFTARECLDRLGEGLRWLVVRAFPSPYRVDDRRALRVIVPGFSFDDLAGAALSQIRYHARGDPEVLDHLLQVLGEVGDCVQREADRDILRRHADSALAAGRQSLTLDADRQRLERRYAATVARLGGRLDFVST